MVGALFLGGCATAPRTASERSELEVQASQSVQAMTAKDPALRPLLDQAAGYIVFPAIKQGGFVVGGAGGRGVIYEGGQMVGFAELSQASVGAQIGGQKYAELVVVRDKYTLAKIRSGDIDLGTQASAVILRQGAGNATSFGDSGISVFVDPIGGAMLNVSLTGQRVKSTG